MASFSFSAPSPQKSPANGKFSFGAPPAHGLPLSPPMQMRGVLDELKIYGDWARGKLLLSSGQRLTVTGNALSALTLGANYMLEGRSSEHATYGAQFEVIRAEPDVQSAESLVKHIVRNFDGVGEVTARRLVDHVVARDGQEALAHALVHNPSSIDFSPYTSKEVKLRDDEDSTQRRMVDSLSVRFGARGLNQAVIEPVARYLLRAAALGAQKTKNMRDVVSLANTLFDKDPYLLVGEVERYGFLTADTIGRALNIAPTDPRRVGAIVSYALRKCCADNGHIWVGERSVHDELRRLDPSIDPVQAIRLAIEQGQSIVIENKGAQTRLYAGDLRAAETSLTQCVSARLTNEIAPLMPQTGEELERLIDRAVARTAKQKGVENFALDSSQREALRGILSSHCSLHTLTGGPGSGKTAIVEVLMDALSESQRTIPTTFCAPIGKAAKVLNERIKQWGQAKTIHATLEYVDSFIRNAENPLDTSFVVTDEQSMLGGPLGTALFEAIPEHAHVLMLGDPDQLAPIEPGRVLKSVLDIEGLDHHRLTTTHRNNGEILKLINSVGAGRCEAVSRGPVKFAGELPEPTPESFNSLAKSVQEAAARFGGIERVGVICPVRRGSAATPGWNVTHLNAVLREAINPDPAGDKKVVGTMFRLNDRIILTRNDNLELVPENLGKTAQHAAIKQEQLRKENNLMAHIEDPWAESRSTQNLDEDPEKTARAYVVNGDTGWIDSVQYHTRDSVRQVEFMVLKLDDGRRVVLPQAKLDQLSHSYAITVHAAQGSEYAKVFGIVVDGSDAFMHRAMLFTMFSRAKEELEVFGDPSVLAKVSARKAPVRNCALTERALELAAQTLSERAQMESDRSRSRFTSRAA